MILNSSMVETKRILYASVLKTPKGKYKAILSDDSIDRENEIVGKSFLEGALGTKIFGLIDHDNKVENRICDWVNKKMEVIKGHNALTAEPEFFLSNPKAQLVKGILDDGGELGISIGAIPTDHDLHKIGGKEYKRWTKGKILEGSFVGIPANENAGAVNTAFLANAANSNLSIAKSLKIVESGTMSKESSEELTKAVKVIVESMKENTNEEVVEVMKAIDVPEEVYKDLLKKEDDEGSDDDGADDADKDKKSKKLTKPKQPSANDKDPKDKDKDKDKLYTKEEVEKLVTSTVEEKLKEIPIFKAKFEEHDLSPEEEKDKAAEIQKSGMIPVIK